MIGPHGDLRAKALYERLLPYADRNAFRAVEGCTGSVSRYLGLLAALMSRYDDAECHFEDGIEHNQRMGARPWVAHTQYDFAVMLTRRNLSGDVEQAIELLGTAMRTCEELGMPALRTKVTAVLKALGIAAPTVQTEDGAVVAEASSAENGTFRLDGEYWTVGYDGRVLRLRDSKGLRVLAQLLANPGRPHPAPDLERLGATGDEATARAIASGDAGEHLDIEARRAYRARLQEL